MIEMVVAPDGSIGTRAALLQGIWYGIERSWLITSSERGWKELRQLPQ